MEWKTIQGYEQYEVSNEGQVRNKKTGRILKPGNNRGYLQVLLCKNGKQKWFLVHRLVAIMWIPNPNGYPVVNHIDENKENNSVDNLEWCSYKYNINYGTCQQRKGQAKKDSGNGGKKVYCCELDQTFNSISEAERETGIWHQSIGRCCKGRQQTAGKMHWKYVES